MPRTTSATWRAALAGVVGVLLCWLLATPRSAGPDEPSHSVASAALVRGDRDGTPVGVGYPASLFEVPAMVGEPNPVCFALQPEVPASCAGVPPDSTALADRESTSAGYPIWGHLLPGVASFVPSAQWYAYAARLLSALLPAALVVAAIVRVQQPRRPWLATGLFVGLTPIAWFAMAVVTPSALAIGGGVALWVALLAGPARKNGDALMVAGWLALLLPRRDGPLWATLVVLTACLALSVLPSDLWARLGRVGRAVVLVSLPLTLLPTLTNGVDRLNTMLALAPLLLVLVEVSARAWRRTGRRITPGAVVAASVAAVVAAVLAANVLRPGGPDAAATWRIVTNTGRHLRQIVGLLGWLDTPPPEAALLLWWMVLGALTVLALLASPRHVAVAAGALATAVVTAWVLELGTGDISGTYWQGRYSIPFVVGVPLILALGIDLDRARERLVTLGVRWSVWLVWNATFVAAMRRWGVGTEGSVYPWRWNTWDIPAHPMVFVVIHALATGWLLFAAERRQVQPA